MVKKSCEEATDSDRRMDSTQGSLISVASWGTPMNRARIPSIRETGTCDDHKTRRVTRMKKGNCV